MSDLKWLGYPQVILKSDNEKAILKLLRRAMVEHRVQARDGDMEVIVQDEHPMPYDKNGNGDIESAVKVFTGQFRTLKLCLERSFGAKLPNRHPALQWLVKYAAWQLATRSIGKDGCTSYQRVRGREYSKRLARFGERVLYQRPT